jgi:non-specific serine/threonine protein kinase
MTGTPIENNTFDLYAQLNFVNPGLLGNITHFKNEFSNAIDKEKDEDASNLLSRMISPFLLRRTKKQVATELPEKIEDILYCEMGTHQKQVYESIKAKYKDYVLKKVDENGIGKSQMYILEALTKLRQACNSTALIAGKNDFGNHSAKLELLIQNLKEKTGQHKVLVFSQFVSMLSLVKTRLDEENIVYEYLDGQTKNRQDNVDNFQKNEEIRVFLISLKAGGTGLNLTKADYVFLIDPWWNPAVENQAIDRCYRIGQTKTVMAYRMICKGTIEEKIMELQEAKKDVAESIIKVDKIKKSFSISNIKDIFG